MLKWRGQDEAPGGLEDVRRWVRAELAAGKGGKFCGLLSPFDGVEFVHAAGLTPVLLTASPQRATLRAETHMEGLFHSHVRGVFDELLSGELASLSALLLPRSSDSAHRLYYYLSELARVGEAELPVVHLFDLAQTGGVAARRYNRTKAEELLRQLGEATGREVGDIDLERAIAAAEERRVILRKVADRRMVGMLGASSSKILALYALAPMLDAEAVAILVDRLMAQANSSAEGRPRIVVAGNAPAGVGVHELIERAGALVVGDMHGGGELSIWPGTGEEADPLDRLLAAYEAWPGASRAMCDPVELALTFSNGADGVIFQFAREEEALTWDFPAQRAALEAAGKRVLRLKDRTHVGVAEDGDEAAISDFVASIAGARG